MIMFTSSQVFALDGPALFLPEGEETSVPYGWLQFCKVHPEECRANKNAPTKVRLDSNLKLMRQVSAHVNKDIKMEADIDRYGEEDVWSYPSNGRGDCEDMALLKRRILIKKGFAPEALSLALVKDKNKGGHIVLIVRTDQGDYAIDNLTNDVKPWHRTGYRFVKYQSWKHPDVWIAAQRKNQIITSTTHGQAHSTEATLNSVPAAVR